MASVSSHTLRYDASLPPGTVRHVRVERERARPDPTPSGDALVRGAPQDPEREREDEEIRATADGDAPEDAESRAFVRLFEEVHTLVRELDAHGCDTGRRGETTARKLLDGHAKKDDPRVAQTQTRRIDETDAATPTPPARQRVQETGGGASSPTVGM